MGPMFHVKVVHFFGILKKVFTQNIYVYFHKKVFPRFRFAQSWYTAVQMDLKYPLLLHIQTDQWHPRVFIQVVSLNSFALFLVIVVSHMKQLDYIKIVRRKRKQPWELAVAFDNAIVNAVLCWFYDGKKNAVIKVFTYVIFLFRFYSVADNS